MMNTWNGYENEDVLILVFSETTYREEHSKKPARPRMMLVDQTYYAYTHVIPVKEAHKVEADMKAICIYKRNQYSCFLDSFDNQTYEENISLGILNSRLAASLDLTRVLEIPLFATSI